MIARRLGVPKARLKSILAALHTAGAIKPESGCRRFPAEIEESDAVTIFIAVLADRQVANVAADAEALGGLAGDAGCFRDFVNAALYGRLSVTQIVVQHTPPAASAIASGRQFRFGPKLTTAGRVAMRAQLAAIAAELAGMSPRDADAAAAIRGIYNVDKI